VLLSCGAVLPGTFLVDLPVGFPHSDVGHGAAGMSFTLARGERRELGCSAPWQLRCCFFFFFLGTPRVRRSTPHFLNRRIWPLSLCQRQVFCAALFILTPSFYPSLRAARPPGLTAWCTLITPHRHTPFSTKHHLKLSGGFFKTHLSKLRDTPRDLEERGLPQSETKFFLSFRQGPRCPLAPSAPLITRLLSTVSCSRRPWADLFKHDHLLEVASALKE